jgi:hypothetical protein
VTISVIVLFSGNSFSESQLDSENEIIDIFGGLASKSSIRDVNHDGISSTCFVELFSVVEKSLMRALILVPMKIMRNGVEMSVISHDGTTH